MPETRRELRQIANDCWKHNDRLFWAQSRYTRKQKKTPAICLIWRVGTSNMDFEQLRTFQLVSRLKSFSRAAEKLGVTQPAISAQVRSLENEVGARLFDREGGKVTFTAAGRLFEPFAEHCLQCHSHILAGVSELYQSPRGELSVSTSEATSLYVLPQVFAQFKKLYSRVHLSIVRAE